MVFISGTIATEHGRDNIQQVRPACLPAYTAHSAARRSRLLVREEMDIHDELITQRNHTNNSVVHRRVVRLLRV